jgi:hypothetical protein
MKILKNMLKMSSVNPHLKKVDFNMQFKKNKYIISHILRRFMFGYTI